ncbi:MAG: D-tyrosyl-tRNA(Tyr) deacylase [Ruminococcaceae bacterium]|nr:D-tyrosyl-tRNA(Tyr) deacylase [Oscillospiraceae bacterium]
MKAVLQRVAHAQVVVEGELISKIENGFLILLGVEQTDTKADADILSKKISGMRVFEDENGKMNLSLSDTNGSVLVISQFTLLADCRKGRRPSFINAGAPDMANDLYEYFCERIKNNGINDVKKGVFGADMKVSLLNDGPVTILLDSKELIK